MCDLAVLKSKEQMYKNFLLGLCDQMLSKSFLNKKLKDTKHINLLISPRQNLAILKILLD